MFFPGQRVVVGCSGGADSSCLLHVLARGLPDLSLSLTAVYVDHGLRPDTRAEQEWVERLAGRCGAEYVLARVDVASRVRATGESVQEAARALRYGALRKVATTRGAPKIAVGHTRTDQAETVLMQALRGAGLRGLSGIAPVWEDVVRPLLWISRQEAREYCREHGLEFVEDPSNASDRYTRNRIRNHLFPLLQTLNPGAERHLAQLAEIAREEDAFIAREMERHAGWLLQVEEGGPAGERGRTVTIDGQALAGLPLAIARRLVRRAYAIASGDEKGLDFDHVERVLERAAERRGSFVVIQAGGVVVRNEYGRLIFAFEAQLPGAGNPVERTWEAGPEAAGTPLAVPGVTELPRFGVRIRAALVEGPLARASAGAAPGPGRAYLDWEKLTLPLVVRPRKAGDRLAPLGLAGSKKVKDILMDAKVPRRERERIPLVADAGGVVWVVGHALAERARAGDSSRTVLRLDAEPLDP